MPPRKERLTAVLDTNVLVGFYLGRQTQSANAQVYRLWRNRRELQLVVSEEVVNEYLEVLSRLHLSEGRVQRLMNRLEQRDTVTHVNLGPRFTASRDPDDNIMLATAVTGKAKFLITNDGDLLEIPVSERRKFRFEIVTPREFLTRWADR